MTRGLHLCTVYGEEIQYCVWNVNKINDKWTDRENFSGPEAHVPDNDKATFILLLIWSFQCLTTHIHLIKDALNIEKTERKVVAEIHLKSNLQYIKRVGGNEKWCKFFKQTFGIFYTNINRTYINCKVLIERYLTLRWHIDNSYIWLNGDRSICNFIQHSLP